MLTIVHAVGVKNKILTGNVGVDIQGLEGWSSLSVRRWVGTTGVGGLGGLGGKKLKCCD